ncbi:two-component system, response regulator YesN [Cohnella sp. OV330]|uniref:response regulator n=1 Tax=Cohnella sp. OV330 TaxID=1855288 RepID=UPI0008EBA971|nr:response regulator [Cohnella sp. OV330]SFA88846.1 two-component system, response regulator YesN [Cohnella sp. OV330]
MFQVLLVDDEPLVRHHLTTLLDWNKEGFELCGEAHNGAMALALIGRSAPHVAIIDVNMPEMNGVELNRTIKEKHPSVRTIMLSSYDDYDYVRECLKDGAVDYLLKHRLDEASLLAILNKAVEKRPSDDRQRGKNAVGEMSGERESSALVRDLLADLARGKPDAAANLEAAADRHGLFRGAISYVAAAVQIVSFRLLTESYSDVQTNRLAQQAVEIMQQSLGNMQDRVAAYAEDGRMIVLFAFKERSEHVVAGEVGRLIAKLQHALELLLNLRCMAAPGYVCGSLAQFGASYGAAVRALDASPSSERPSLFNDRVSLTIEEQKELLLSIERLDKEGMHQLLASVFSSVRGQPVHAQTVQMIVSELLHTGDKAIKKWMPTLSSEAAESELPSRADLGKIAGLAELELWLQSYYAGLLKLLRRQRANGPYSRHVSQAIELILERYQGYITLELAAGAIGLNPSYLSRIFKEETRATFSEYLNRVRIDVSCRLLESGRYSIKQISTQAGFANYNYFFKVFKEIKGMTPQAYLNGDRTVK